MLETRICIYYRYDYFKNGSSTKWVQLYKGSSAEDGSGF